MRLVSSFRILNFGGAIQKMKTIKITFFILFAFMASINVNAQWTTDTDANTVVVDSEGGDMQAISASDGKTFIVFWESVAAPINYELRLQILDVDGSQLLGNNGMLVSDQIPMSTFTYIWLTESGSPRCCAVFFTLTRAFM